MIIAIDGYEANVGSRVGIGRYAYEILVSLYVLLSHDNAHRVEVRVYVPTRPRTDMPKETTWWHYYVRGPQKLWTFVGLPLALKKDKPEAQVVFSPTHYIPRFTRIPRVMAVMDLSYLYFPELFRKRDLYQLTNWTKYGLAHASAVCTISQFSKNDIIKRYGIGKEKVFVTFPGFSMQKTTTGTPIKQENSLEQYKIAKHFILSVGTLQPRKNYVRLIEAFSKFLQKNKQKFGEVQLVIIGKKGWLYEQILSAPSKFGVVDKVKFLDFVPDSDLPSFYRQALCFALPSLYEGFGLPVLEAMAYKCPVVISNVSSLPEIADSAGIYVVPTDVDSIANGLLSAVRQRNLIQGKTRIQRGLVRVKQFTWEKAAKQTLDILTKAGAKDI
ncbi:MAG TPA: glycosyltransferase family 1 protein [Patescibacteria group bacterium]|nr:glycosyltransferase family 1 protein [Patescibacteria group bacterium]